MRKNNRFVNVISSLGSAADGVPDTLNLCGRTPGYAAVKGSSTMRLRPVATGNPYMFR